MPQKYNKTTANTAFNNTSTNIKTITNDKSDIMLTFLQVAVSMTVTNQ